MSAQFTPTQYTKFYQESYCTFWIFNYFLRSDNSILDSSPEERTAKPPDEYHGDRSHCVAAPKSKHMLVDCCVEFLTATDVVTVL